MTSGVLTTATVLDDGRPTRSDCSSAVCRTCTSGSLNVRRRPDNASTSYDRSAGVGLLSLDDPCWSPTLVRMTVGCSAGRSGLRCGSWSAPRGAASSSSMLRRSEQSQTTTESSQLSCRSSSNNLFTCTQSQTSCRTPSGA